MSSLAVVAWHCYKRECYDPKTNTWVVAYIGSAEDDLIRAGQHKRLVSGASRPIAASAAYTPAHIRQQHVISVPIDALNRELKEMREDLHALETYLMEKYETIVHEPGNIRKLLAHANQEADFQWPDISLPGQPRNFKWNCRRATTNREKIDAWGVWYEAQIAKGTEKAGLDDEAVEEIMTVVEESFSLAIAEHANGLFGEPTAEELGTSIVVCEEEDAELKVVVFEYNTPYMVAFQMYERYAKLKSWEVVERSHVVVDLTKVTDETLKGFDKEVKTYVNRLLLGFHEDAHSSYNLEMTAREAEGIFVSVCAWTGGKEERALGKKADEFRVKWPGENPLGRAWAKLSSEEKEGRHFLLEYDHAIALRSWMIANDGRTPSPAPKDDERSIDEREIEKTIGRALSNWSSQHNQRHRNVYLVLLRHLPAFVDFCRGRDVVSIENATTLNGLLKKGFGTERMKDIKPDYIQLPSQCAHCYSRHPVWILLQHWLNGSSVKLTRTILEGLPTEYAAKLRKMHDDAVDACKETSKASDKRRRKKMYEQGLRKKRVKE